MHCVIKRGPALGVCKLEPFCEGDEPPIYRLSREGLEYAVAMGWRWVTPPFQPFASEIAFREIAARGWLRERESSSDEQNTPGVPKKEGEDPSKV